MAEQKAATPAKKRTTATAGATKASAASKPRVAKTATETPAKKPPAKKPVAKKATAAATETKKVAAAKTKPAAAKKAKAQPTPEERYRMVETAAYFIAERHGFQGDSTGHWVAAEAEIAALLGK
ncbi:MAG: DUF2934 domain-containing protein [Nitrosomonadales bacterium]|nr:DUF2934 domain-containing protein [Nitrosomonadales bacterium]